MPFDGSNFPGNQGSGNNCLLRMRQRAATAFTLIWTQRPTARRAENRPLQLSIEVASVPELLCAARSLIASEGKWVRRRLRTRDGKFCAMGAILEVSAREPAHHFRQPAVAHLLTVARQRRFPTIERMNDFSTHAEILAAFDEAIRLSKAIP